LDGLNEEEPQVFYVIQMYRLSWSEQISASFQTSDVLRNKVQNEKILNYRVEI
jgi:hypothetical protein